MESVSAPPISSTFIWRRVHSLMGFWLVLYLILHLLTNSQAALWFGTDGSGFVKMVNALESLPYLHAIEVILIGVPLAIHMVWGIQRALTARPNVHPADGLKPSLKYERNRAYSLQRLSSWILLLGILGHVVQMRFVLMPTEVIRGSEPLSMVKISRDEGLNSIVQRFGVTLYNQTAIEQLSSQNEHQNEPWTQALSSYSLQPNEVVAVAPNPGTAILLMVRNTFKSPWMVALYTLFVLAAAFHAFNGFWTFLITWGAILSYRSQQAMIPLCLLAAAGLALLGLAAIFGSYWL